MSDLEECRKVLTKVLSPDNQKKYAVFMVPIDISTVPDYLSVCGRAIDLSTIHSNLMSGKYSTGAEVWAEIELVSTNAIKYHSGRKATKWIASAAKSLMKLVNRERKALLGKPKKTKNLKIKLSTKAKPTEDAKPKAKSKPKVSIKLKPPKLKTEPPKPKIEPPPAAPPAAPAPPPEKKKPKLKLTLSLNKNKLKAAGLKSAAPSKPTISIKAIPTSSSTSSSTTTSTKQSRPVSKSPKTTPKIKISTSAQSSKSSAGSKSSSKSLPTSKASSSTTSSSKPTQKNPTQKASSQKSPSQKASTQKSSHKAISLKLPTQKNLIQKAQSQKATTQKSPAQKPAAQKPAVQKPTVQKPTIQRPAVQKLAVQKPAVQKPAVQKPAVQKPAIRLVPPSRGKELPKGVSKTPSSNADAPKPKAKKKAETKKVTAKSSTSKPTTPKSTSTKSSTTKANSTSKSGGSTKATKSAKSTASPKTSRASTPTSMTSAKTQKSSTTKSKSPPGGKSKGSTMSPQQKVQCMKVIAGLRRRQFKNVVWFLHPVSDKAFVEDYKAKIPHPMDLGTMSSKLDKGNYKTLSDFCLDLRRVFGNCLRFNTTKQDSFRPIAVQMLVTAEEMMAHFIGKPEAPNQVYPPLLYCWKLCVGILDALLNVTNPGNGHQTAHFFMHPASYFFGGSFPPDYLQRVKQPMDFGTVTSNLIEGKYKDVASFSSDCRLVINNCLSYYEGREDGKEYTQHAQHLKTLMSQQLDALARYDQSPSAAQARHAAISCSNVRLAKPPEPLLMGILTDLRALKYTDRLTKMTQPAMSPFEKPVSLVLYPNYLQFVTIPMDLEKVERKVRSGLYETPEDFEQDVHQIFRNCESFNAPRKMEQLVAMGKYGAKEFRKLFNKRMKAYENPEEATKKRPASQAAASKPSKKAKIEDSKKAGIRTSITGSSAPAPAAREPKRSKSPKLPTAFSQTKKDQGANSSAKAVGNQPVPLHVAIAEVKSRYPLRRQLKFLNPWEAACAKFFKELMKHPWISAARPKFIFHVPVPTIFPELKQAYLTKIKKPMDLTTAEAKLLQGGIYCGAQDLIDDVALVFANAISFNKAGRDEGDHLSISYYDASIHLLRYARWLSLEHLSNFLTDDPHADDSSPDGTPPLNWKLSKANKAKAREEVEAMVMVEHIAKSIEGDRTFTWMETECEKLLKALRHQSDLRYMTFFIQPNYPADYAAFISKPMDWERVQRTLQKRQYNKFEEIVADLRLIFTNARKYNSRHKDTDTVSGRAYDAANYMSKKLEIAIDKMLLNVSDRLERERIENSIADREAEAAERVEEEERLKKARLEGDTQSSNKNQVKTDNVETARTNRRASIRRDIDLEVTFFEENDGNHEQSHGEYVRQQRATFEQQLKEKEDQHNLSLGAAALLFGRQAQCEAAVKWTRRMSELMAPKADPNADKKENDTEAISTLGSKVAAELNKSGRAPIKLVTKPLLAGKKRKRSMPLLSLE